jgi:hypothetical protein
MASKKKMNKYLPVAIAVAAGGLLLWFTQRKAGAAELPEGGGGETPSGGGGTPSGGGGGTSGGNAPAFPGIRASQENNYIDGSYSEWIAALGTAMDANGNAGPATMDEMRAAKVALGIPSARTPGSWYADAGLQYVYGISHIPANSNSTWQPYKDAWNRMWNRFKSRPLDPT